MEMGAGAKAYACLTEIACSSRGGAILRPDSQRATMRLMEGNIAAVHPAASRPLPRKRSSRFDLGTHATYNGFVINELRRSRHLRPQGSLAPGGVRWSVLKKDAIGHP